MPLIPNSTYRSPFWLRNGHVQTVIPSIWGKAPSVNYTRERLELEDGDFLDLDWKMDGSKKLVVLTHGLEGNTGRGYILHAANHYNNSGFDVLAWHCRSCSGELNRNLKMYCHGSDDDLELVLKHALSKYDYETIYLVGYSMGGSITLNYLGRRGKDILPQVKKGYAISAPVNLKDSSEILDEWQNWLYSQKFKRRLYPKMREKAKQYPNDIDIGHLKKIKSWLDFDKIYTVKINNFESVESYYYNVSAHNRIANITVPTLILNAKNDPILGDRSYPYELCESHDLVWLETPERGGHVCFPKTSIHDTWVNERGLAFFNEKH